MQAKEDLSSSATARRKLHNPDEPLQRPTTPGGSFANAPPPDSTQDELPTAEETAALLSERTAPAIRPDYPSLDQPAFEQREVRVSA